MKKRRIRRTSYAGASGLTPEDRKAMQTYSMNRRSSRYHEDLDAINTCEKLKPKTDNEPK